MIAYEPVWAIGVTTAAAPVYVAERHRSIRAALAARFGAKSALTPRIIYGGSVTLESARELLRLPEVEGLFVGRAALDASAFRRMAALAREVSTGAT